MTEILSQDEISALLGAIARGEIDTADYRAARENKTAKIYDFRRPDKFASDQIRTLQMMHETFARLFTTTLSARLRMLAAVHVASVAQFTYEEVVRSFPNPATLAIVDMDPLKGSAVLEMDPRLSFAIIDRLFGGVGEPGEMIGRELTDIELSVMESLLVKALGNLRESWSYVVDLRPRLSNIETNPQFAQIVPPNDMVLLITLETKIGSVEGMINLCLPYIVIEPLLEKFTARYWFTSALSSGEPLDAVSRIGREGSARRYVVFRDPSGMDAKRLGALSTGCAIPIPRDVPGGYKLGEVRVEKNQPE